MKRIFNRKGKKSAKDTVSPGYGSPETIRIEQANYGKTKLFEAVEASDISQVILRIAAGDDVNKCAVYGDSPLQIALCSGNVRPSIRVELATVLIHREADINYIPPSEDGNTVSMMFFKTLEASDAPNVLVISLIRDINFNIVNEDGETARSILISKYPLKALIDLPGFPQEEILVEQEAEESKEVVQVSPLNNEGNSDDMFNYTDSLGDEEDYIFGSTELTGDEEEYYSDSSSS